MTTKMDAIIAKMDEITAKIYEVQYVHCQTTHMGITRVYEDCPVCLAMQRLASQARECALHDT